MVYEDKKLALEVGDRIRIAEGQLPKKWNKLMGRELWVARLLVKNTKARDIHEILGYDEG